MGEENDIRIPETPEEVIQMVEDKRDREITEYEENLSLAQASLIGLIDDEDIEEYEKKRSDS